MILEELDYTLNIQSVKMIQIIQYILFEMKH